MVKGLEQSRRAAWKRQRGFFEEDGSWALNLERWKYIKKKGGGHRKETINSTRVKA